jgi:uncharacterized protein with NAD-binding domain and iron-sulfur cluster
MQDISMQNTVVLDLHHAVDKHQVLLRLDMAENNREEQELSNQNWKNLLLKPGHECADETH